MAFKLVLPRFGMAMQKAKVIEWMKDVGDFVETEEAVLVVENEKLVNEIISMEPGTLIKKVALVGEDYFVGDTLAWLGAEGESIVDDAAPAREDGSFAVPLEASQAYGGEEAHQTGEAALNAGDEAHPAGEAARPAGSDSGTGRASASPLAKKLAAELHLDYTLIKGTGPGGRIGKEDVLEYAESLKQQNSAATPAPGVSLPSAAAPAETVPGYDATAPQAGAPGAGLNETVPGNYSLIPYTGMRKAVGEKMQSAWRSIPMVTHHVRADAGALAAIRRQLNEGADSAEQRYSVNDLLLKLAAAALQKYPAMNATFENDEIRIHKNVNLGIATALEDGLIVPVIRKAEEKSLPEISAEAKKLIASARAGRLAPDDIAGGTFTVTNLGGYGSVDFFTPIVNPPQAAILGVGRIADAAVPVGGAICIRPMIGLSLTYDHRAVDGAAAAEFMKEFITLLNAPLKALLC